MTELAAFNAVSAAFARAPDQEHSLACLINAAVRLHCRALEAGMQSQVRLFGAGMSDKAVSGGIVHDPDSAMLLRRVPRFERPTKPEDDAA